MNTQEYQYFKPPWKKIRFKTNSGHVCDGFIYAEVNGELWVSENSTPHSIWFAQNWAVREHQILKLYE